jgi:hypothetical protein
MIENSKPLILVVGAGASKEAGLPIGSELKTRIADALDIRYENSYRTNSGDKLIDASIRLYAQQQGVNDINPHLRAARRIAAAMPLAASIDNFIDAHRDNSLIETCGKLAIARCILEAEASSLMRVGTNIYDTIDFKSLEKTWYKSFFQTIVLGAQLSDIPSRLSRLAIVTFNYDRCIEMYLHGALRNYYEIDEATASSLLKHLTIFHPYGHLGEINPSFESRFGAEVHPQRLIDAAKRLKTFTEGTDESGSEIVEIRATIAGAAKLVYLGFSFNPQNLALLYGNGVFQDPGTRAVFGTAYGLSNFDVMEIGQDISKRGSVDAGRISLRNDLTCAQLFHEFSRALMI